MSAHSNRASPTARGLLSARVAGLGSVTLCILVMLLTLGGGLAQAQRSVPTWPQWGGPQRNFHVEASTIARAWPDGGPVELWRRPLGEGYSAILVADGRLVTMYRDGDHEVVVALNAETGATVWEHAYDAPLAHNGYVDVWHNSAGPGPYSTPIIVDGTVFAVGVDGHLHALDLHTGTLRWSQDLVDSFDLTDYNAFASSPLSYGRTIILPLGGSGNGVAAFDRETGAVAWQSEPFPLAPGSPLLIDLDGQTQLVTLGQQELVGLSPADGRRLWSHPHANELGLHLSTPVWGEDNRLFVSSGYDTGSRVIELRRVDGDTTATEVWHTNRMRLHFGNALQIGGLVLGSSGDFGPAFLTALDAETGAEVWRERSLARAQMVYADGVIVVIDEDGEIAIASVTDGGLDVHARASLLTGNAWTPPSLVGTRLYVRDRRDILALDLGE